MCHPYSLGDLINVIAQRDLVQAQAMEGCRVVVQVAPDLGEGARLERCALALSY